ncbi:UDP-N-acetylmuramate dehydrogenase [Blattabacterium cuenoti]|uniref:UDP-N-acetylmuramate dehydrogenase n=1 Tax=Blattabacterium cuenoti TaxID=1653831 RepID=UPI00163BEAF9|nr:UDP-N-acetylmuramate dehydrogenase [Blattabacterium cuenoti]
MSILKKNFCIQKLNTFGIMVYAHYFLTIQNIKDLHNLHRLGNLYPKIPKLFLGNGSNILFINNYYPGILVKMGISGKKVIYEKNNKVIVKAYGGENWNDLVSWTIKKGFSGLENLSHIPGTVGAAPIQNIGAYGTEIKDVLLEVKVYEINQKKFIIFSKNECKLKYRSSFFKQHTKYSINQFLIVSVSFLLRTKYHNINTSYLEVQQELENMKIKRPTINDLSLAIYNIRTRKLPNPKEIGNAGSFFKNPIIDKLKFNKLKDQYPTIKGITFSKQQTKVSASSLIEIIGWKGKKIGNVGSYEKQPIILVNYGNASGKEIYCFSKEIIQNIKTKFNITLSLEVDIIK